MVYKVFSPVHAQKCMVYFIRDYYVVGDWLIYRIANAHKTIFSKFAQRHFMFSSHQL